MSDTKESANTRGRNVLDSKHPTKCWLDPFTDVGRSWSDKRLSFTRLGIVHPSELQMYPNILTDWKGPCIVGGNCPSPVSEVFTHGCSGL